MLMWEDVHMHLKSSRVFVWTVVPKNCIALEQMRKMVFLDINFLIDNKIEPNKLLPGTGLNSIKDTVFYTKAVAKMNVRGVLVLPPFYYKNVTNDGLINYYTRVVEDVGEAKLHYLLYHFPQMSCVGIDLHVIEKLLYKFPDNIIGIKDSTFITSIGIYGILNLEYDCGPDENNIK